MCKDLVKKVSGDFLSLANSGIESAFHCETPTLETETVSTPNHGRQGKKVEKLPNIEIGSYLKTVYNHETFAS